MEESKPYVKVNQLQVSVKKDGCLLHPVNTVDLEIPKSTVVGLVGESGCGKSMAARAILGIPARGAKVTGGSVVVDGRDITRCSEKEIQRIAGNEISMIFQDPMTSLNPTVRIGKQIEEVLILHTDLTRRERKERVLDMLRQVGIPDPEARYRVYPHQLSGGLRQRVVIAMALICRPGLLIADEPTTALDVTIENQILKLMHRLKEEMQTSILMISHNLGMISSICDLVHVMYLGEIVESAKTDELLSKPYHPYTQGIMDCLPEMTEQKQSLSSIPGNVPDLLHIPKGCRFADRCSRAAQRCRQEHPGLTERTPGHKVRCFYAGKEGDQL